MLTLEPRSSMTIYIDHHVRDQYKSDYVGVRLGSRSIEEESVSYVGLMEIQIDEEYRSNCGICRTLTEVREIKDVVHWTA